MQIHVEAHLILNINTSVSEFAMKMFPPLTSCFSHLLFSSGQCRMESLGPKLSCCFIKKYVWWRWISPGWDSKTETIWHSWRMLFILRPSSVNLDVGCSNQIHIWFVTDFIFFFFFCFGEGGGINSATLWDPNYRLVLNFVLFLHQLGWSQHLFCLFQHMVPVQDYSFQNVFLRCVNNGHRALGT